MAIDLGTLFTSVKAAYDIVKGINSLNTTVERNEAVAKVTDILLSVQSDALLMKERHSRLLGEIDNLNKKILEFEKWSEMESQYALYEVTSGVFVYAYKKTDKTPDPSHWLCAKCFNADKKKSILQRFKHDLHGTHYKCHTCNSEILDHSTPIDWTPPATGGGVSLPDIW